MYTHKRRFSVINAATLNGKAYNFRTEKDAHSNHAADTKRDDEYFGFSNYILSNQISDDPDSKTSNSQRTTSEYRLQREFDSKEAFCEWWKNGGLLGWYRNDAYTRKTGEEVQTFR
jgi:hypothetical protein